MTDKQTIQDIRDHYEEYGLNGTYYPTVMFLMGLDVGRSNGLLRGFIEWLVVRQNERSSAYWHQLVLLDLFPDMRLNDWKRTDHLTPDQHRQAVEHLFALLLEFLDVRNDPQDLGRMYTRYAAMSKHLWE
ncbi:hypothetical protein ACIP79_33290 [Streptomyces sp. NPDC088747]|uniref:hypothetical protein n=1 Tax=Streptomyces sp. NPDC088747 TaxID=3365886 RepID=UPI00380464CD